MAIKYGSVGAQCKTAEKLSIDWKSTGSNEEQTTTATWSNQSCPKCIPNSKWTTEMHTMKCVNIYYLSGNFRYMLFPNNSNNNRTKFGTTQWPWDSPREWESKGSANINACVYRIELFKQHLFRLGCCFFESICTHEIRSKIKEMGRKGTTTAMEYIKQAIRESMNWTSHQADERAHKQMKSEILAQKKKRTLNGTYWDEQTADN